MLACEQILRQTPLKNIIASVVLILPFLHSDVIQDRDGFLWLAGINGAIKYNGYETEPVSPGETVSALFEDSEELIWMVVRSGVAVYNKKTGEITKYVPNPKDPKALSGESLVLFQKTQLLTEDTDGFIWIATVNGLNKFDKKSGVFTAYQSKPDDPETLSDNNIRSVLTARDGSLWVGTATGLHKFNPRSGPVLERYATNDNDPNGLPGRYVQATVEDDENTIWAGTTEGGLNRLDPRTKTFTHYQANITKPPKITHNFIYRLAHFVSAPDLIRITTVDGLSMEK